jgi:hypothetical protein
MPFEIVPGFYFVGFFYLDFPAEGELVGKIGPFGRGGNLQALVWKEGEEHPGNGRHAWTMRYRFRYYRDARVHAHQDKMSWFQATMTDCTEAEAIEKAHGFVTMSGEIINQKPHVWMIQGNFEKFAERVKTDPPYWMHLEPRLDDPEFAKEFGLAMKMNRPKPKILEGPMR